MLSGTIASQLRDRGRDVAAVIENTALVGLADDEILAEATTAERALVTCNIRDFVPLDQRYKASGRIHSGLVLVSSKAFPQDRSFIGALVSALDHRLGEDVLRGNAVMFLGRCPERNEVPGAD